MPSNSKAKLKPRIYYPALILLISSIACLILTDCDQSSKQTTPKVNILANEVIVDKSFIYKNNPERYQPSYNIRGSLVPIDQVEISSPYQASNPEYLVKKGDWVKKGQVIARLQSFLDINEAYYAYHDTIDISINHQLPTHLLSNDAISSSEAGLSDTKRDGDNDNDADGSIDNANTNVTNVKKPTKKGADADKHNNHEQSQHRKNDSSDISNNTDSTDSTSNSQLSQLNHSKNNPQLSTVDTNKEGEQLLIEAKQTEAKDAHTVGTQAPLQTNIPQVTLPHISESKPQKVATTLMFKSPIEGEVTQIDLDSDDIAADEAFLTISDTRQLQLIGKLPIYTGTQETKSQLSVGQPVGFKIYETHTEFAGQISHITPHPQKGYITVRAPVIVNTQNQTVLKYGMQASMTIEYGQMELGVRVPKRAIHEADLSELTAKYPRPVTPISGYVWVIKQDQTLAYTPVQVVQYFPESNQFLVNGINNHSLICLADLPKNSHGKKISVD